MAAKKKGRMSAKKRIIRHKKQSSVIWYIIGAVIAAFALAIGNESAKKGLNKVEAYLAARRRP